MIMAADIFQVGLGAIGEAVWANASLNIMARKYIWQHRDWYS